MAEVLLTDLIRPAGRKAGKQTNLPVYSVTKHSGFVPSLEYFKKQVFSRDVGDYKVVEPGDFAYATIHLDEGSIGIAPQQALISPMYTVFKADDSKVDPGYLIRFLKSPRALSHYPQLSKGAVHRRKTISLAALGSLTVPLPSLGAQRRIVAILEQADTLRTMRRQVLAQLHALTQATFRDTFGAVDARPVPLSELADVTSGITKGRRTSRPTSPAPYLAVSNVQAGFLNLGVVKEIDATAEEVERYALRDGDLLLTEGGDPDKLGRGTVWRGELPLCLHQNHVFRVRIPDGGRVDAEYLSAFMADRSARAYFLRAAKQTTGIASINMKQLKALPVTVPSRNEQSVFVARLAAVTSQVEAVRHALVADDELFASLQSRAFRGEL